MKTIKIKNLEKLLCALKGISDSKKTAATEGFFSAGENASASEKTAFTGVCPLCIAVCGKMASGKNYVCSLLEKNGFKSIDADLLVHSAIEKAKKEILEAFGPVAAQEKVSIIKTDGTIDRRALGKILFARPELLKKQEAIVYPVITDMVKAFIAGNSASPVIINATVLYKTPELLALCDCIVYVKSGFFKRLVRARKRDHLPFRQIFKRFNTQKTLLKEYKACGKKLLIVKN